MGQPLPPPAAGRERAAAVWGRGFAGSVAVMVVCLVVLLVTLFVDVSAGVLVFAFVLGVAAMLVAGVCAVGVAWARAVPFWQAARIAGRYLVDVVARFI